VTIEAVPIHRGGRKRPPEPPHVDPGLFGVYVHVPFCLTRCHYCDFVTYTGMEGLRRPYAAALGEEAAMVATLDACWPGCGSCCRSRPGPR
jgi:coproporphyrinogen III oxidase-like Fe-S oxidoreductase